MTTELKTSKEQIKHSLKYLDSYEMNPNLKGEIRDTLHDALLAQDFLAILNEIKTYSKNLEVLCMEVNYDAAKLVTKIKCDIQTIIRGKV